MRLIGNLYVLFTVVMVALSTSCLHADGLLGIAPLRITLTDTKKTEMITLTNRSDQPHTYNISLENQIMNDKGNVLAQKESFAFSATRMVRFMPHTVTLAGGGRQNIRVMATPPEDLADGDYHAHLVFTQVPVFTSGTTSAPEKGLSLSLEAMYNLGIPIIVQHGNIHSDLKMLGARLVENAQGKPVFQIKLQRSGNAEAKGLISVMAEGISTSLVTPRTAYVYHEVDTVELELPLRKDAATLADLRGRALYATLDQEGKPGVRVPVTLAK